MAKKHAATQAKTKDAASTYSDLLAMHLNLQRSLAASPENLKAVLQLALTQIEAEMAAISIQKPTSPPRTWHLLHPRDTARITCGHCGEPATICDHGAFPGFYYYCHVCAQVGQYDHVWHMISNEDSEQIMCSRTGCDEHATHCEWAPTGENKGVSKHFCHYHLFES